MDDENLKVKRNEKVMQTSFGSEQLKNNLINTVKSPEVNNNQNVTLSSPDEPVRADIQANELIAKEEIQEMSKNGVKALNDVPYSHVSHNDFANGGIPGHRQTIFKWVFTILFTIFLAFMILIRAKMWSP
ncbi:MAG TPA: hypothetical protein VIJ68_01505 [Candidatus Saccharimonadales bacterium]